MFPPGLDWGNWEPPTPAKDAPDKPAKAIRPPGTVEILCTKCNWWFYLKEEDPALGRLNYRCRGCAT